MGVARTGTPSWRVHPGAILREEFLKPMGISAYALAKRYWFRRLALMTLSWRGGHHGGHCRPALAFLPNHRAILAESASCIRSNPGQGTAWSGIGADRALEGRRSAGVKEVRETAELRCTRGVWTLARNMSVCPRRFHGPRNRLRAGECRPIFRCEILFWAISRVWPPGDHDRRDPSAWTKFAFHLRPHRLSPAHYVVQDPVDDVLLKNPQIAVALQILL